MANPGDVVDVGGGKRGNIPVGKPTLVLEKLDLVYAQGANRDEGGDVEGVITEGDGELRGELVEDGGLFDVWRSASCLFLISLELTGIATAGGGEGGPKAEALETTCACSTSRNFLRLASSSPMSRSSSRASLSLNSASLTYERLSRASRLFFFRSSLF